MKMDLAPNLRNIIWKFFSALRLHDGDELQKITMVSLYFENNHNVDERVLQILSRYRVNLSDYLSPDDIQILLSNYQTVIDYCSFADEMMSAHRSILPDPIELAKLYSYLSDIRDDTSVYLPFAGMASIAYLHPNVKMYAEEIDKYAWALSMIGLDAHGCDNCELALKDSFDTIRRNDAIKYDRIVVTPPFGRIDGQDEVDSMYETYNNMLAENGVMVCVLPAFFYRRGRQVSNLVRGPLRTVINLPQGTFYPLSSISISLLVLKKDDNPDGTICLVSGENRKDSSLSSSTLNSNEIINILNCHSSDKVLSVSLSDITKNNNNLIFSFYDHKPIEISEDQKLIKLGDVLSYYPGERLNVETQLPVAKISDLATGPTSYRKTASDFKSEDANLHLRKIAEDLVLISRIGHLKPTFFCAVDGPICLKPNVLSFKCNSAIIDVDYLIGELNKPYVKDQLKSYYGNVLPTIPRSDLLNLKIIVPEGGILAQKHLVQEQQYQLLSDSEKELQVKVKEVVDAKRTEYVNLVRMRKHDMRPSLRNMRSIEKLMRNCMQNKSELDDFDGEMLDLINQFGNERENLSMMIDHLSEENIFGEPEKLNLDVFFIDMVNNTRKNAIYDIEYRRVEDEHIGSNDRSQSLIVNISRNDFLRLVTNIIENARQHGFVDPSRYDYREEIILSIDHERNMFCIDFSNNGKPMPEGMTKERYGLQGEKAGATGGSGMGGYIVKSIVSHYNGDYDIISEDDRTIVRIFLPIASN
jgi:type I restriction enzyme M protein